MAARRKRPLGAMGFHEAECSTGNWKNSGRTPYEELRMAGTAGGTDEEALLRLIMASLSLKKSCKVRLNPPLSDVLLRILRFETRRTCGGQSEEIKRKTEKREENFARQSSEAQKQIELKVSQGDFTITKLIDKSSPILH